MDAFIRTMENPSSQIDASISQQAVDTVMQNKAILISIIKCLEFCGRNDIAIRGHQPCLDSDKFDMTQKGKYKALPKFCVDAGDEVLKKHLEGASKHKHKMLCLSAWVNICASRLLLMCRAANSLL